MPISSWNRIHSEVAFSSRVRKPSEESSPFEAFVRARVRYSGFGKDPTLVVRRALRHPPPLSSRRRSPCHRGIAHRRRGCRCRFLLGTGSTRRSPFPRGSANHPRKALPSKPSSARASGIPVLERTRRWSLGGRSGTHPHFLRGGAEDPKFLSGPVPGKEFEAVGRGQVGGLQVDR